MKNLGILGGMSPMASSVFYRKVVKILQKEYFLKQNSDFPFIYLHNIPISPSRNNEKTVRNILLKNTKKLEELGSEILVMPCNTAHVFIDEIRENLEIPVISIVESTWERIREKNCKIITIFATDKTIENKLYQKNLQNEKIINPDLNDQKIIQKIIHSVQAGENGELEIKELEKLIDKYSEISDGVILGCTELPLVIHPSLLNYVNVFDTLDILAHTTVKKLVK